VHRLKHIFSKKEAQMLPELHQERAQEEKYVSAYKRHLEELEILMNEKNNKNLIELDKAWTAKNPEQ
jgi:CPA2 family monovalent cation:H+ antiporter-2/glutathione-regulated potassium-efflux system ancillary protein KefC